MKLSVFVTGQKLIQLRGRPLKLCCTVDFVTRIAFFVYALEV